jgi:DNA-binding NarL/FixJ family response regulator
VVDDDPALHAQVAEQLLMSGEPWHVTSYHNGLDALKGVAGAPPQVVSMDIGMPEMNGIECAHVLKLKHPGLPVVLLTTQSCPKTLWAAMAAGAPGYWVKGGDAAGLVKQVCKLLAGEAAFCDQAERLLPEAFAGLRQRTVNQWGLPPQEWDAKEEWEMGR